MALSIVNVYGSIGFTNYGYIDKVKPGILKELNAHDGEHVHTFLDDIVGAISPGLGVYNKKLASSFYEKRQVFALSSFLLNSNYLPCYVTVKNKQLKEGYLEMKKFLRVFLGVFFSCKLRFKNRDKTFVGSPQDGIDSTLTYTYQG